jgi:cytochrome c
MKKALMAALACAGLLFAGATNASQDLAQKNACMSCHSIDKKVVGPAFKDVAAKYKGDKTAEAKLIEKVKKGGAGVWGQVPMPPNSTVKDADIQTLVKWILSL